MTDRRLIARLDALAMAQLCELALTQLREIEALRAQVSQLRLDLQLAQDHAERWCEEVVEAVDVVADTFCLRPVLNRSGQVGVTHAH